MVNLIPLSVRSDWHVTFDADQWAIVPTMSKLQSIASVFNAAAEGRKKPRRFIDVSVDRGRILRPVADIVIQTPECKGHKTTYLLVFFEPLNGQIYHRARKEDETEFDKITVNSSVISEPFEHTCHPYFAIWNARRKFAKHVATLTVGQQTLHRLLEDVLAAWISYSKSIGSGGLDFSKLDNDLPGSGGAPPVDDADDNAPGPSRPKRPRTAKSPSRNGSDPDPTSTAEHADDAFHLSKRQKLPPTPPTTPFLDGSQEWLYYPDWNYIITWLANVAEECDPVEEQNVEWAVHEVPQPPLQKLVVRDRWTTPPDTSKFSSANWATYVLGTTLTRSVSSSERLTRSVSSSERSS